MVWRSQAGLVTINWNCKVEVRRIPGLNPIAIIREPKGLVTGCSRLCLLLFNKVDLAYYCYMSCFVIMNTLLGYFYVTEIMAMDMLMMIVWILNIDY